MVGYRRTGGASPGMTVKGSAFFARRKLVVDKFGQEAWDEFFQEVAPTLPLPGTPIVATSLVPIERFLKLQDAILRRFFGNDPRAYWTMGLASAQWALTDGPYRSFMNKPDLLTFVAAFPLIWSSYYNRGRLVAVRLDNRTVDVQILDLPIWDISFELMVMGFVQRALELFCDTAVKATQVSGGSARTPIHYVFSF